MYKALHELQRLQATRQPPEGVGVEVTFVTPAQPDETGYMATFPKLHFDGKKREASDFEAVSNAYGISGISCVEARPQLFRRKQKHLTLATLNAIARPVLSFPAKLRAGAWATS